MHIAMYLLKNMCLWNDLINKCINVYNSCKTSEQKYYGRKYIDITSRKVSLDVQKKIGCKDWDRLLIESYINGIIYSKI